MTVVVGEAANFIAYSFAPAIVVTPMGALSVVIRLDLDSFMQSSAMRPTVQHSPLCPHQVQAPAVDIFDAISICHNANANSDALTPIPRVVLTPILRVVLTPIPRVVLTL